MIQSFGNKLANDLFEDLNTKTTKKIPHDLRRTARRKILYLHDASDIKDLRVPPGNRLELLKGKFAGFHSIRINKQWRIVFHWKNGDAFEVQVLDYHK